MRELLAKGSDATFLREMIGFAAQRLMELETETLTGAAHGERSPDRQVQRNGYRGATGIRGRARWSCASRGCARAPIFQVSWSRAGWRRRR